MALRIRSDKPRSQFQTEPQIVWWSASATKCLSAQEESPLCHALGWRLANKIPRNRRESFWKISSKIMPRNKHTMHVLPTRRTQLKVCYLLGKRFSSQGYFFFCTINSDPGINRCPAIFGCFSLKQPKQNREFLIAFHSSHCLSCQMFFRPCRSTHWFPKHLVTQVFIGNSVT